MIRKVLTTLPLLVAILVLLYLALQPRHENHQLGLAAFNWLNQHGVHISLATLRILIHIPEYFLVGISVFLFGNERNWSFRKIALVTIGIGITEESIKHFLPYRDFDLEDIGMDIIGACIASLTGFTLQNLLKYRSE